MDDIVEAAKYVDSRKGRSAVLRGRCNAMLMVTRLSRNTRSIQVRYVVIDE